MNPATTTTTTTTNATTAVQLTPGEAVARKTITAYTLTPQQLERSHALYRTRVTLSFASSLLGLAALAALVWWRFGPRVQKLAERCSRRRLLQAAIVVSLLQLVVSLVQLPLAMYAHRVSLAYGLSVQGWGSWIADQGKLLGLSLTLAIPLAWGLYALIRRSPRRWWLYAWLCSLPVAAALVFAAPVVIDPLFQRFEPLANSHPKLTSELQRLAHTAGLEVPSSRIYLMDASEKHTTYNAYVTGLGASKRIVVWDTTARDLTIPQIGFVFSHEMGHYVLHHIYLGLAFTSLLLFAGLGLTKRIADAALRRYGGRWQIRSLADWSSLPLLALLASALAFFSSPAASAFSRWEERAADTYAMAVTQRFDPDAAQTAAQTFQLLGERSYAYPTPSRLLVFWSYSHPPLAQRIQFVLSQAPNQQ